MEDFLFFILIVISGLSFWNYNNRVYDWDMPGYIGCLYTLKFPDSPDKVRTFTYRSIKEDAPESHYKDILGVKPVDKARQVFASNTKAFSEQIPYFQIKLGYNLAILIMYELGFSAAMSVSFLSIFSYFISGFLIFLILKIIFPENYLLTSGITIGVMLLPPMTDMSRVATPDMFIFQFLLVFMIGLLKKWNKWIMFLILFGITFTRPDYAPFTLSYLCAVLVFEYFKYKRIDFNIIIQGIVLFILYFSIMKLCHYPGWKNLFYDSFIFRRPIISAQPADFGLREYLDILYIKIIYFKRVTVISVGLLLGIFYLSKNWWIRICAIFIFANVYVKFLFFPHSSGLRFFFGFIMCLLLLFLYVLSQKYNGFKLRKIA
ncbi:hypothetical protein [Chryseobacterium sp. MMS23-Vi53]|uniref:hypothetical protein n=1 Tax=Chryseobacterium sp. MMS23-Vi53 TaxID=3386644 RepID=UPI0039E8A35B